MVLNYKCFMQFFLEIGWNLTNDKAVNVQEDGCSSIL